MKKVLITITLLIGLFSVPTAHAQEINHVQSATITTAPSQQINEEKSITIKSEKSLSESDARQGRLTPTTQNITPSSATADILTDATIASGNIGSLITVMSPVDSSFQGCNCEHEKSYQPQSPPIGVAVPFTTTTTSGSNSPTPLAATTIIHVMQSFLFTPLQSNFQALALTGNILLLFYGAYLRLRSGRSPGWSPLLNV